ncbi:MAG: GNAT family N-acetyltransferase [Limibacillus sp.]
MADIVVRWAGPGDAAAIARMLNALNVYVGCEDGLFSEAQVLDHFFGERRVVSVLLAEAEGRSVGLATLIDFYNSDRPTFSLWLNDLYVEEAWRSSGAGRKLMAAAAKEALARGGDSLWWGVLDENRRQGRGAYPGTGRGLAAPTRRRGLIRAPSPPARRRRRPGSRASGPGAGAAGS